MAAGWPPAHRAADTPCCHWPGRSGLNPWRWMEPVTTPTLANDRDPTLPPTLPDLILQWVRRASVSALALSLLFHAILLLIAAKFIIGGGSYAEGGGEPGGGPIEMAVVTEGELTQLQDQALGVQ